MLDRFAVELDMSDGFAFDASFGAETRDRVRIDERPPLGRGTGPDGMALAAAAVGHALASTLLFSLLRSHIEVVAMHVDVNGRIVRGTDGRPRIAELHVVLRPGLAASAAGGLDEQIFNFDEECALANSLRAGIDLVVDVRWPHDVPAGPLGDERQARARLHAP